MSDSETKNKRYSKAMTLKLPRSDLDGEAEDTQALLQFHYDMDEDRGSRFQRVWFAAENEKQHLSWHSELLQFAKGCFPHAFGDLCACCRASH